MEGDKGNEMCELKRSGRVHDKYKFEQMLYRQKGIAPMPAEDVNTMSNS
jgi:hypothetical protein